jgi:hypothetical protein
MIRRKQRIPFRDLTQLTGEDADAAARSRINGRDLNIFRVMMNHPELMRRCPSMGARARRSDSRGPVMQGGAQPADIQTRRRGPHACSAGMWLMSTLGRSHSNGKCPESGHSSGSRARHYSPRGTTSCGSLSSVRKRLARPGGRTSRTDCRIRALPLRSVPPWRKRTVSFQGQSNCSSGNRECCSSGRASRIRARTFCKRIRRLACMAPCQSYIVTSRKTPHIYAPIG